MISFDVFDRGRPLNILCLGAHCDDIEIGVGATLLKWLHQSKVKVYWAVLSANGERGDEASASAEDYLATVANSSIELESFKDGFFPSQAEDIKCWFNALSKRVAPDIIFTHWHDDAHQDHRLVSHLTQNTFRDHLILEYEIPKWDGDLGRPNTFIPATREAMQGKVDKLMKHFVSQRSKDWFDEQTFLGLGRLRGMECRAKERYAEAFHVKKMIVE